MMQDLCILNVFVKLRGCSLRKTRPYVGRVMLFCFAYLEGVSPYMVLSHILLEYIHLNVTGTGYHGTVTLCHDYFFSSHSVTPCYSIDSLSKFTFILLFSENQCRRLKGAPVF